MYPPSAAEQKWKNPEKPQGGTLWGGVRYGFQISIFQKCTMYSTLQYNAYN